MSIPGPEFLILVEAKFKYTQGISLDADEETLLAKFGFTPRKLYGRGVRRPQPDNADLPSDGEEEDQDSWLQLLYQQSYAGMLSVFRGH